MLFVDMLSWWYGRGWVHRLDMLKRHANNWLEYFSVGILLKTLFSPWRQNGTTYGKSQKMLDRFLDVVVSRMVGFFVRLFALIAAFVTVLVVVLLNLVYVIIWPLLPVAPFLILLLAGVQA